MKTVEMGDKFDGEGKKGSDVEDGELGPGMLKSREGSVSSQDSVLEEEEDVASDNDLDNRIKAYEIEHSRPQSLPTSPRLSERPVLTPLTIDVLTPDPALHTTEPSTSPYKSYHPSPLSHITLPRNPTTSSPRPSTVLELPNSDRISSISLASPHPTKPRERTASTFSRRSVRSQTKRQSLLSPAPKLAETVSCFTDEDDQLRSRVELKRIRSGSASGSIRGTSSFAMSVRGMGMAGSPNTENLLHSKLATTQHDASANGVSVTDLDSQHDGGEGGREERVTNLDEVDDFGAQDQLAEMRGGKDFVSRWTLKGRDIVPMPSRQMNWVVVCVGVASLTYFVGQVGVWCFEGLVWDNMMWMLTDLALYEL
ncbi:hypothetical protein HK097_005709 [Rhizophlyctis rosea]|uniref:Uncharacterized protein n=1 Tax=Rhizophlyctis rosea TaxID=64517 RepID=A0AAD5S185_9FUNG|nr:hypothetical protein HK097_005709 [Rhizophlyctis rosea]